MNVLPLPTEESFHDLVQVLNSVTSYRQDQLDATSQLIAQLSDEWVGIRRAEIEENAEKNHHFNPLRVIKIREVDHSRILGGLLNPRGSHGQGRLFLDSFLGLLGIEPRGGRWTIKIESNSVDILLYRNEPASVVIIENKANKAVDQEGQLYRYWFREIYSRHRDLRYDDAETAKNFKVVYLPPGGYARPTERSLMRPTDPAYASCPHESLPLEILDCRSFQTDVTKWLREIAERDLSARIKTFLNLYAEIWSI
jgi:hypothetical protein